MHLGPCVGAYALLNRASLDGGYQASCLCVSRGFPRSCVLSAQTQLHVMMQLIAAFKGAQYNEPNKQAGRRVMNGAPSGQSDGPCARPAGAAGLPDQVPAPAQASTQAAQASPPVFWVMTRELRQHPMSGIDTSCSKC